MSIPSTLPMTDEDGTQLCIELSTPLWGEESAGYEWECTFNETIKSLGWMPCPGVPAMFSYHGEHGEARMITIVDDFMISEVNGTAATEATIAALKAAFDGEVKVDYSPLSRIVLISDLTPPTANRFLPLTSAVFVGPIFA